MLPAPDGVPDVVLLCGGQGTRLRSVFPDIPKPLVPIGGTPFLDIMLQSLERAGFRRVVVGVGYLRDKIETHLRAFRTPLEVVVIPEDEPLGTGGGLRNALRAVKSGEVLAMNGDSLCKVDFDAFRTFHRARGGIMSMVLGPPPEGEQEYGVVATDAEGRIINFQEKPKEGMPRAVSAGIYLLRRDANNHFPADRKNFSLEYDLFPAILGHGCYGFPAESAHIDIGTPERYARANELAHVIKNWYGVN